MNSNLAKKESKILEAEFTVQANSIHLSEIREKVTKACREASLNEEDVQDLCLVVTEAAANSIRHSGCDSLSISLSIDGGFATAKVVDYGKGFSLNKTRFESPSIDETSGRGFPIIRALVDQLSIESKKGSGTSITMVKRLAARRRLKTV
ncbi:MAG: ATP-binding protein [Rubrobacteridae bacterium]|nr:ATP-binding protein [Rubrobacteridae bacterium]